MPTTAPTARVIVIPLTCRASLASIKCFLALLLLSEGKSVRASALFHLVPPCGKRLESSGKVLPAQREALELITGNLELGMRRSLEVVTLTLCAIVVTYANPESPLHGSRDVTHVQVNA